MILFGTLIQNLIYFFWIDLHLQIIASISPKPSVENSSAQWAILWLNRHHYGTDQAIMVFLLTKLCVISVHCTFSNFFIYKWVHKVYFPGHRLSFCWFLDVHIMCLMDVGITHSLPKWQQPYVKYGDNSKCCFLAILFAKRSCEKE